MALGRRVADGDIGAMHTSQVRQRVLKDVARQIPYVYTPLYEGGEHTPGVFAIGETPGRQLRPAIEYLASRYRARRWMFVGNDYVWPRVSHRLAARYVAEQGGEVVADRYLPFNTDDFSELLDEIRKLKPHAILLSLVGQDAVQFNRAFGRCGLSRDMIGGYTTIFCNRGGIDIWFAMLVLAPLTGLLPSSGSLYIAKAFITVITGGAAIVSGTLASSVIFGTINQIVSFGSTPVIGEIAMLALAIILLRLMPQGITGRFFRSST